MNVSNVVTITKTKWNTENHLGGNNLEDINKQDPKKDLDTHTRTGFFVPPYNQFFEETLDIFQTGRRKSEFFLNRKLTSVRIVFCWNKTFSTHFDCEYVRINRFFL